MTRVLFLAVLAAVVSSCTTNQTAVLPPLPAVEAHVISSNWRVRRELASTTDQSILEAEFQQLLNSDDLAKLAPAYVDRVARVFYRTQGLLNDFDKKLDTLAADSPDGVLQTDDSYARLMAAWTVREETLEKARYFYYRALYAESHPGDDSQISRQLLINAHTLSEALRNAALSSPNSVNRLAKQDLIHAFLSANQEFHDYQTSHDAANSEVMKRSDESSAKLKAQFMTDGDAIQKFYRGNAAQLKRETDNALNDKEVSDEIEKIAPEMKSHMTAAYEQRAPQAVGSVKVSSGRSGMMNGTEFAKGVWALTYDDGPHPTYTLQDLANLQAKGMKATFFWVASNVKRMHSIVSKVAAAGMTLANHSYTHAQLTKLGPAGLKHEVDDAYQVDVDAGYTPKFYRCPYGACGPQNSAVRKEIAEKGMISVTWNVDSLDWQDKNPASVYERVKKQMAASGRGIILFHDIHPQSVTASKMLMADFAAGQKSGQYRTISIDQAFKELNSAEGMK